MMLGPFLFGAPLALLGLIALPVIWYILRATPPAPQEAASPSLASPAGVSLAETASVASPVASGVAGASVAGLSGISAGVVGALAQPMRATARVALIADAFNMLRSPVSV